MALLLAFTPTIGDFDTPTAVPFWQDEAGCVENSVPNLVKLPHDVVHPSIAAVPYRPYSKDCPAPPPPPKERKLVCGTYTVDVSQGQRAIDPPVWNDISQSWQSYETVRLQTTSYSFPDGVTLPSVTKVLSGPGALGRVASGTTCIYAYV